MQTFNPINYGFRWTSDWYEWDSKAAHESARKERDDLARDLKKQGKTVKKGTIRNQLMSRGGIGSGHPHIECVVTVYTLCTD